MLLQTEKRRIQCQQMEEGVIPCYFLALVNELNFERNLFFARTCRIFSNTNFHVERQFAFAVRLKKASEILLVFDFGS